MTVAYLLAKANAGDAPGSDLALTMTWLLAIAGVAVAAFVPFRLASPRGQRRGEMLTALIVVWAVIAAGSAIKTSLSRAKWAQDYELRLQSGFYDPADPSNTPPAWPWGTWARLAAGYGVIVLMAARGGGRMRPGFDVIEQQ